MTRFLVVALEGDVTAKLDEIVRICGKIPKGAVQLFNDWSSVSTYVGEKGALVAGHAGEWTILCDDGSLTGAVFDDLKQGDSLATHFSARVVSAVGASTSCIYGYRVHSTKGTRAVLVRERVEQNFGEPVPGEPPVVAEDYNEESVLAVLQLLEIDIEEGLEACDKAAMVWYVEKPWWKLWSTLLNKVLQLTRQPNGQFGVSLLPSV